MRIGIILPEDKAREVRLAIADGAYRVNGERSDARNWILRSAGDTVDDGRRRVALIRFEPDRDPSQSTIIVRNCRAGRGFHWEQRIDLMLPGVVEVQSCDGVLMVVNELPLETYLPCVITAEMSGQCPLEFLKAQCVTARSWMLAATERKHAKLGIDFCNDDCCQRFQGISALSEAAKNATQATTGQVMIHETGVVVDANYSKCCGGIVESPEAVWGRSKPGQYAVVDGPDVDGVGRFFPVGAESMAEFVDGDWLKQTCAYCSPNVVPDDDLPRYLGRVDDGGGHFRWRVVYEAYELADILNRKRDLSASRIWDLQVTRRGVSGRATNLEILYDDNNHRRRSILIEDQYRIRDALSRSFLYSSAFDLRIERSEDGWPVRFELVGAGWGHGAGLCQIGALGMGILGHDYRTILHHYFESMRIEVVTE